MTGDCSAGLRITVLPATSAATVMPVGIASGKFQGGMTTATPRGRCSVKFGLAGDVAVPRLGQPDHLAGVELAEVDGLGDVAIGLGPGLAALVDLPRGQLEPAGAQDRRRLDQDRGAVGAGVAAQAGNAARAAATAASACSTPASDVWPTTRELWLGLTEIEPRGPVSTSLPPIRAGSGVPSWPRTFSSAGASPLGFRPARSRSAARCGTAAARPGQPASARFVLGRRVRVSMAPISSGLRSRSSIGARCGEARLQERLVRRVLEQPPHQVGHARQHGAVGGVDPHAMAAVDQGALDQVAHAEERLKLVGDGGQPRRLGRGDRVGQAADVVAAEGRAQLLVVLEQEPGTRSNDASLCHFSR